MFSSVSIAVVEILRKYQASPYIDVLDAFVPMIPDGPCPANDPVNGDPMVRDMNIALRALHEVLVATRNMALANAGTPAVASIIDSIEAIPIWMADPITDRTEDIIRVLEDLAAEYPECEIATSTARRLRDLT